MFFGIHGNKKASEQIFAIKVAQLAPATPIVIGKIKTGSSTALIMPAPAIPMLASFVSPSAINNWDMTCEKANGRPPSKNTQKR